MLATYSDLGLSLLGFILEDARGNRSRASGMLDPTATLAAQFRKIAWYMTAEPLTFNPPRPWRKRTAPTEIDAWRGRLLTGEVHDENTWALGGVAAHAGLFGTAPAVGTYARAVLTTSPANPCSRSPRPSASSSAGQPSPAARARSAGTRCSRPRRAGRTSHRPRSATPGFTGTSLWIDWERDLYIVLLTNRVHPTRDNELLRTISPGFTMQSLIPNHLIPNRDSRIEGFKD